MNQLVEYFPYKIILINVEQLTWNKKGVADNLYRAVDYHYAKLVYLTASIIGFKNLIERLIELI